MSKHVVTSAGQCLFGILVFLTKMEAEDLNRPVRVLCIGDSITQGGSSQRGENTYRFPLYRMISSLGINVDFVGSQTRGTDRNFVWPGDFDRDHEAYGGCGMIEVRNRLRLTLPTFAPPDIAIIHLGTNDQEHHNDFPHYIGTPLGEIIDLLRARNPQVVILIGHLSFSGGKSLKARPVIEGVARQKRTAESPIITVRHYEGWIENPKEPGHDCHDWVHPNPQGEQKMAEKWFAAMIPYLGVASARLNPPDMTASAE